MFFVFEISRPFARKPGLFRNRLGIRVWWLWFAVSVHFVRYDEMMVRVEKGYVTWRDAKYD